MKRTPRAFALGALGLLLAATSGTVSAHTGHGVEGLAAGFAHPFLGLDHLLAMVAVGLWAGASTSPWQRAAAPFAFVAAMALGALLVPRVGVAAALEPMLAVSVVVLGGLLIAGARLPAAFAIPAINAAGLLHGAAHGLEAAGAAFGPFVFGMVVATALLHGVGLAAGATMQRMRAAALGAAGAAIGAAGVAMFVSRI